MRVLVVSQYFWPETFRVNEIVSELVQRGHSVTVLTAVPNYPEGVVQEAFLADPTRFARYEGAEVIRLPVRPRGKGSRQLLLNYWSFVFWGCLLGPWKLRGKSFDAIFMFETSPITSALPALLLKRFKRAPLTMWVLDLWPDSLSGIGMVRSERLLNAVGALCAFIYRGCDLILGQSRAFEAPIARWSRAPEKFRYFPAWAEGTFDQRDVEPAPELSAHRGVFTVMFAGNLGEAQDFPTVLEAARRLRHRTDIHWLIVGDGRAADGVRQRIAEWQLEQTVFMLGRHPVERMPAFFAGAGALLVSLKAEPIYAMTIPGKVQSYLAAGRPILALLDGEGARVVQEAGAGLTAPAGDAATLASQVEAMAAMSPERRDAMGRAGRAYCDEHFGRARLIDQLVAWLPRAT